MANETVPKSLIPIAILSTLIFGKEEDKLLNVLKELGVLRDSSTTEPNPSSEKGRQITRAISINANGKVEVERQFVNGTEKFSVTTKTKEPLRLHSLDQETFVLKEKDIKLNFQLRDVELHDINNFVIKGMKTLSKDDDAKIMFDLPETMRLACRYQIHGMVLGHNVHEGGHAELRLSGVQVNGRVKVHVTEEAIQVLNLDLTYTFNDLKINKVGLIVAGMSKEEINKLFNEAGKKYLKENMLLIAERISNEIKNRLNERLKDISSSKIAKSVRTIDEDMVSEN